MRNLASIFDPQSPLTTLWFQNGATDRSPIRENETVHNLHSENGPRKCVKSPSPHSLRTI